MKNFIKFFSILFFLLLVGCSSDYKEGINVLYIYDISGSFHTNSLENCLATGEQIFKKLAQEESLKPQIHQTNTISALSVSNQTNCSIKIDKLNINAIQEDRNYSISHCLEGIASSNPARSTDIQGAILNASLSLSGGDYIGKIIFVFSDFKETVNLGITESNLEDVIVVGIQDIAIDNKGKLEYNNIQKYQNEFKSLLLKSKCKDDNIKIFNLKSLQVNQDPVIKFLKKALLRNNS